jgi:MOSC domain-containing protein YiiM
MTTPAALSPKIEKLWIRAVAGATPEEQSELELKVGEGVVGDHTFGKSKRHVTVLFREDWNVAASELGKTVDPVGRRANVLLSGAGAKGFLEQRVRLGEVLLEVKGITRPCQIMEQAATGMREALQPEARAGFWAQILEGGKIRPGDELSVA